MKPLFNKMYYIPTSYYFLGEYEHNLYNDVLQVMINDMKYKKRMYERKIKLDEYKFVEKTTEYNEYKSCLIKVILAQYAPLNKDVESKKLIDDIMNKWNNNEKISKKYRELKFELSKTTISKYEREINNIEKILMLTSLEILENYYN
jgi:hypothetical protein